LTRNDRKARLLLAEDDEDMRSWLRTALDRIGCDVSEATSGFELLDRLAEDGPYDLVITAVRMSEARRPHPSGLQVAAMAREAGLRTPFLVLSDNTDAKLPEVIRAVGRAALLAKPFDRRALLDAVRALLLPRMLSHA
jgi:two-component system, cell cycle sensor histidine kinase and response regulator CckA